MISQHDKEPDHTPTKVLVIEPFRVVHEGNAHVGGDQVTVPKHLAEHWLKCHWVEPVTTTTKEK